MARYKLDDDNKASEFKNSRKQRRTNRLSKRNGDVVSIEHGTGDIDIDTTPVDELFPGKQVGAAAVKERSARQPDESIRKSLDDYKESGDRYNSVIGDLESAGKLGKYDAVQARKGELPYQTWERATGLKWSEAKKRGYTTGRDQENLQLQRDLLAGNVSKQGGYSDERPEGYKNSKLGQGSYYLTKPKQTAPAATRATQYREGYISNKNVPSISGEIAANRDYVPGQKFNPYKTFSSFKDGLAKNTKAVLYGGGPGTGGGPAKLPTQPAKLSTQNSGKQTKTNTSVSKNVRPTNLQLALQGAIGKSIVGVVNTLQEISDRADAEWDEDRKAAHKKAKKQKVNRPLTNLIDKLFYKNEKQTTNKN